MVLFFCYSIPLNSNVSLDNSLAKILMKVIINTKHPLASEVKPKLRHLLEQITLE